MIAHDRNAPGKRVCGTNHLVANDRSLFKVKRSALVGGVETGDKPEKRRQNEDPTGGEDREQLSHLPPGQHAGACIAPVLHDRSGPFPLVIHRVTHMKGPEGGAEPAQPAAGEGPPRGLERRAACARLESEIGRPGSGLTIQIPFKLQDPS